MQLVEAGKVKLDEPAVPADKNGSVALAGERRGARADQGQSAPGPPLVQPVRGPGRRGLWHGDRLRPAEAHHRGVDGKSGIREDRLVALLEVHEPGHRVDRVGGSLTSGLTDNLGGLDTASTGGSPGRVVALVPDRHGQGTNALVVSPPGTMLMSRPEST